MIVKFNLEVEGFVGSLFGPSSEKELVFLEGFQRIAAEERAESRDG